MAAQNLAAIAIQRQMRGAICRVGLVDIGTLQSFNQSQGPGSQMQKYIDFTKATGARGNDPMDGYQNWCAKRIQVALSCATM